MPLPAALIAGIASAAITGASNIFLSERQRKKNEEYQDKQNEYNSPEQQMQRLQAAGINPNAYMTGSGTIAQGNLSAGINPYQTPNLGDPFSMAANSYLNFAQGKTDDQLRSVRIAEAEANVANLRENANKLKVDTQYQSIINSYAAVQQEMAIKGQSADIQMKYADIAKLRKETKVLVKQLEEVIPAEVYKTWTDSSLNIYNVQEVLARIANIEANTELQQAQTEGQEIENQNAQEIANLYMSQLSQTVSKLKAETNKTEDEIFYMLYDAYDKYLSPSVLGFKIPANLIGWHANEFESAVNSRFGNRFERRKGAAANYQGR